MPPKFSDEITALFRARPKLRFVGAPNHPAQRPYEGVSKYLNIVKNFKIEKDPNPPFLAINEARIKRRQQRVDANEARLKIAIENYRPKENPNATSDPNKTMFICNVPLDVTEDQIKFELKAFGPVECIKFPVDINTGVRKNYCFAEYVHERSFKNAMLQGTRLYFNNQKMIVDKERGRTEPGWLPRRLGGGIGAISRRFSPKINVLKARTCKKKYRSGHKWGKRYRGVMREVSRKKDELIGINRESVRKEKRRKKIISKMKEKK